MKPASLSSDWKLGNGTASISDFSKRKNFCFLRRDSRGIQGTKGLISFSAHIKMPEFVLKPRKKQDKHTELLLQREIMFDKHFRVFLKNNLKKMQVQKSNHGAGLKF